MTFRANISGLPGLSRALARIVDEADLQAELQAAAEEVRAAAIANLSDGAPPETRTGTLARSLFIEIPRGGGARIGTPLDYGWHLEMGTQTRAAYPWLAPALQDHSAEIIAQLRRLLSMRSARPR